MVRSSQARGDEQSTAVPEAGHLGALTAHARRWRGGGGSMAATSLPPPASRPLEGWALLLARSVWLVLVALQLASFVPLLPAYPALAEHPCPANCLLTAQEAQSLTRAGIALNVYVGSLLVVAVLNLLLAATMAGMIFVRRSREVMALITAYTLPLVLDLALEILQTATIYGVFLLFPSGRFVPRRSWALLLGFAAYTK